MDWWQTIITALASILGGAFTFFGVYITLKYQNKKERYDKRPSLVVTDYKSKQTYTKGSIHDLGIFLTKAEQEKLPQNVLNNTENWVCAEYSLMNIGKSEARDICVVTLLNGNTHIRAIEGSIDFVCDNYGDENLACLCRKCLKPQEIFKLRICYYQNEIIPNKKGAPSMSLWLSDGDRKISWRQFLFAPDNVLSDSVCLPYKRFFKEISPTDSKGAWRKWRKAYKEAYKKAYK